MKLSDCRNVDDFKKLAKQKLPSPIFHYIDGGADDEVTLRRNTKAKIKKKYICPLGKKKDEIQRPARGVREYVSTFDGFV